MQYVAFDAHKHYTLASVEREDGRLIRERQIPHERAALQAFLQGCDPGSSAAVKTTDNWYWIVDEIEGAGRIPRLVHARKAKLMMGMINKTDKLARAASTGFSRRVPCPPSGSPQRTARPARPAPDANGPRPPAHPAQEQDPRCPVHVWREPVGRERPLRPTGP